MKFGEPDSANVDYGQSDRLFVKKLKGIYDSLSKTYLYFRRLKVCQPNLRSATNRIQWLRTVFRGMQNIIGKF